MSANKRERTFHCEALHHLNLPDKTDTGLSGFDNKKKGFYFWRDWTEKGNYPYFSGGAFELLLTLNNGNFQEAIKEYESITGIDIKKAVSFNEEANSAQEDSKYNFYHSILKEQKSKEAQKAHEYLTLMRGLTDKTIDEFNLGYNEEYQELTIPFYVDLVLRSYNNRKMPWARHPIPKYRRPKEEEFPNAGAIAFNIDTVGAQEKRNRKNIFLTEGMIDAITLEQCGYSAVYFSNNISNEAKQTVVKELKRYPDKRIVLIGDNDDTGRKYQKNSIEYLFNAGIYEFDCCVVPRFKEKNEKRSDYAVIFDETIEGRDYKDINEFYAGNGNKELANNNVDRILKTRRPALVFLAYYYKDDFNMFLNLFQRAYKYIGVGSVTAITAEIENNEIFEKEQVKLIKDIAKARPTSRTIVNEILEKYENKLMYHEARGLMYFNKVWHECNEPELYSIISDILGERFDDGSRYDSIIKNLIARVPKVDADLNASNVLVTPNGTLYLNQVDANGEYIFKKDYFDPLDYRTSYCVYDYDPEATCPTWRKTIEQLTMTPDDETDHLPKMLMLQEFCGYILEPDNSSRRKCLFIRGNGVNGKNLFTNTLQNLFNRESVTNIRIGELKRSFKKSELKNSVLNIAGEEKASLYEVAEDFKSLISGDPQQANVKYKSDVKFIPRAKLIITSNEFIRSNDKSEGVASRLILVEFLIKFVNKTSNLGRYELPKDIRLGQKLKKEGSGILNWIIEGYKMLEANGDFTYSREHKHLLNEFVLESDPKIQVLQDNENEIFDYLSKNKEIRNRIELKQADGTVTKQDNELIARLWSKYQTHCALENIEKIGKFGTFKREIYNSLKQAFPDRIDIGRDNKGSFARLKVQEIPQEDIYEIEQEGFIQDN